VVKVVLHRENSIETIRVTGEDHKSSIFRFLEWRSKYRHHIVSIISGGTVITWDGIIGEYRTGKDKVESLTSLLNPSK